FYQTKDREQLLNKLYSIKDYDSNRGKRFNFIFDKTDRSYYYIGFIINQQFNEVSSVKEILTEDKLNEFQTSFKHDIENISDEDARDAIHKKYEKKKQEYLLSKISKCDPNK